ncbi:LOW QUALITY PROTEIN: immunoglobulin superfamily member 10 [Sorex fumeus]|uniref:LOW QUALITY PROTEIN: immunoglobulin superfamily member 10 n=1 Tax=Sorex fumeus TaxID=62283 RepID=UPI0024ADA402|nr:LOW QUALITY PROTEIN: immunoglobulin superfamily member 10 [Sorex fumeus]
MVKVEGLMHLCFLIFVTVSWLGACPACGACPRPCTCYLPTEVHCTFRYLTSIPDGFPPHVERVNLGYNSLVRLAETDFSGLSRLEMLLLHSNGIHTIPDKTFSDLGALQVLKLSYNKVRRLQRDALYGLSNLTRLHLDHNGLEFINPQAFYGLTALRLVQLEGNQLTRLHADTFVTLRYLEVFRTSSIRYLHLSDNLLSSLPREMLSPLSSLESLYLHGNPWTCDCHLSWLAGWTLEKPDVIKCKKDRNPSNPPQCPLCTNPRTAQGQLLARVPAAAFLCAPPALEGSAGDRSLNAGPWGAPEPISPQDFAASWGSLALNLTDQAGNEAAVVCRVEKPGNTSSRAALAAENSSVVLDVAFAVSLACDLAEGHLLAVWQILAPYSDAPLLLERNRALPEAPGDPYGQVAAEPDDTFTGVQATLRAQPTWLLQARASLWLDRAATTPQAAWLRWSGRARFQAPSPEPEPGPWTLILSEKRAQLARTVLAGRTVALDCPGLGHPAPRLQWLLADGSRVGAPHTSGDGRVLVHRDGTLEMRAADTSDTGAYRCVSTAAHDTDVLTYWVTVVEAPGDTAPQGRPPQVVFLDEPLDLPCGVTTGSPDPRISWVLPGAVVLPGPATDRHALNNGTLRIARVTRRDQGIYRCVAANPLGVDVLTYRVAVRIQGPREPLVETEGSGLGTPDPPPVPRPAPALGGAETGRPVGGQRRGRFWEQRRQRLPSVRRIDPRHWAALLEKARRRDQPGAPGSPPGNAPVRKAQRLTAPREEESSGLAPLGEEEVVLATTASQGHLEGQTTETLALEDFSTPWPGVITRTPTSTAVDESPATPTVPPGVAGLATPTPLPHFGETQSGPQPDAAATEAKGLGSPEVTTLTPNWPGQQKAEDSSSQETPARKTTPALGLPVNPRSRNLFERPKMVGGRAASYTVLAHSDAFLPCVAVGNPPPTLRWTRVSSGLVLSGRKEGSRFQVLDNGTLSIQSVDIQDRGQYLCSASNAFGSDHLYVTLSVVSYPPRMLESLAEELLVHSGSTLALPCRADGRPRPSIAWTLPNQTVVVPEFSDGAGRAQVTQEGSLVLRDLGVPDQGFYRCTASNVAGQDWLQVKIQVIATPPVILEPKRQVVAGTWGHSLRLPCTATGVPLPGVRWVLPDGSEVGPLQPAPPKLLLFANGTLQVSDLASSEQGTYRCLATSPAGSDARLVLVTVEPLGTPPKIYVASPTWTEVDLGGRLRLDCSATGQPQPRILWRLPSKAVVEEQHRMGSRIHVYSNGSLAIDAAADKDEGDYLCVARNPSGEDLVSMHVGLRREAARISGEPLLSQQVRQGGAFRVDCPASGAPPPDISWVLPDGSVARARPGGRRARGLTLFANGTLHLSGVGAAEQGDYTCRAQNALGRDEMRVRLTVVPAAPRIQPGAAPAPRVRTGDTAVLDCEVAGEPAPTRFWLLPSGVTVAASRGRYALHANGSLAVSRVTPRDGGAYVCVARNPGGGDARTYQLHVQDAAGPAPVRRATAGRHSRALLPCAPGATWLLPGAVALRAPYHGGRLSVHANGSLEIRNVRPSDAAEFVCVAPGQRALAVRLDVLEPARRPSFRSPAHEKVVARLGRPTALHCAADGYPPPDILWVLPNGTRLPGAGPAGNASLVIPRTARSHAGRYRCTARNAAGYVEKLVVVEVSQRPVILTPALGGVFGLWGEPLWLHCVSDGSPKPRLAWTVPPGAVLERPGPQGPYVLHENGTLVIRAAEARDTGSYVCQARNSAGRAHIAVPVTVVAYAPRITRRPPRSVLATTGTAVRLSCGALGVPRPLITWEGPAGPPLPRARRGSTSEPVTQPGTLVLHDPQTEDSGTYKCTARNSLGSDSAVTFLRVI